MSKRYPKKNKKVKRDRTGLIALFVIIGVFAVIGLLIWKDVRPGVGTKIPAVRSDHVNDGDPVDSPSDPPTSGSHYGSSMPAGIYTKDSAEYISGDYEGYIIHSLEHGYVVFWYNCDLLNEQNCSDLLSNIRATMDEFNGHKLIAFPRPSISNSLVMTSWEYMQEFDTYDSQLASKFIQVNQPLAPEPNAP